MATKAKLQILVADDHTLIRAGIRGTLGEHLKADFVEARDAREALQSARTQPFDLILLDVTMPGRSGLDIIGELKAAQPDTPVLVLSMHAEEQFALRVLRAGASGYVTKSTVAHDLLRAVDKVLTGGNYVSASLGECLAEVARSGAPERAHSLEALSAREFEVLRMIAQGKAGKEIAAELSLSFKTVSTYRTRLLDKLGLRTNADLTQYAMRTGLIE